MPRIDIEPTSKRVNIRYTQRDLTQLRSVAEKYGISLAELVRRRSLHIPLPRGDKLLLEKINDVLLTLTDIRGELAKQGGLFKDQMSKNPRYTREISDLLDEQSAFYKMLCERVKTLAKVFAQIIMPVANKIDENNKGGESENDY